MKPKKTANVTMKKLNCELRDFYGVFKKPNLIGVKVFNNIWVNLQDPIEDRLIRLAWKTQDLLQKHEYET